MKNTLTMIAGAAIAVCLAGTSVADAQAFRMTPDKPKKLEGNIKELGKAGDVFLAWKVARLEGAEYFTKNQETLRELYQKVGLTIRTSVVEDRLQESTGRQFLSELLSIGRKAKKAGAKTESSLKGLEASVKGALVDNAKAETLSPTLNKLQWLIGEIVLYGSQTSDISKGKLSMIKRRLISLEEREEGLKKDGELSDRDRARLREGSMDIWRIIVKDLRDE